MIERESRPRDSPEAATQLAEAAPIVTAKAVAAQYRPEGPQPAAADLLVGALLWPVAGGPDPGRVLALVADDDIEDPPLAAVLAVVRSLIYAGEAVSPVVVADELRRAGGHVLARERLRDVVAAGAVPVMLRRYAAAVVAESLRRRVESAGHALSAAADTMAEADLAPLAGRAAAGITDCAARLTKLRGGA